MNAQEIQRRLLHFERLCRERGLPLTVQRRDVFKAILEREDHPTADQVFEDVKERIPGLSRTTVYRVLDTLFELGVIRRIQHHGLSARFDGKTHRHHHMACRTCDRVIDVDSKKLDDLRLPPSQRHGFEIEDYSVHFVGVCATCRQGES